MALKLTTNQVLNLAKNIDDLSEKAVGKLAFRLAIIGKTLFPIQKSWYESLNKAKKRLGESASNEDLVSDLKPILEDKVKLEITKLTEDLFDNSDLNLEDIAKLADLIE